MKYSIIIPVLNEEKLILNLLRQVSNKELKEKYNYEVLISDGGSRDNTLSLVRPYADKIILHTENNYQKIAVGRNRGAEAAEGEILIFLNGDVTFADISLFFSILEEDFVNSEYIAFSCDVLISPEEETFTDRLFLGFYCRYFRILNLIGVGMARGECQVIRKKVFDEVNGNNPLIAAGEDFELFTRLRKKGKILYSRKTCIYESPRRYRKQGHIFIFLSWLINSFSVIVFGRSASRTWSEIR